MVIEFALLADSSNNNSSATGDSTNGCHLSKSEDAWNLMGEGHRFFDLVRTGRAAQAINGFVPGKHDLFPIPFQEIQFSNGNWSQNPNY